MAEIVAFEEERLVSQRGKRVREAISEVQARTMPPLIHYMQTTIYTVTIRLRTVIFASLAPGTYLAVVTAVGPGGETSSGSVAFLR